jgi:DNA-binding protein H-NS
VVVEKKVESLEESGGESALDITALSDERLAVLAAQLQKEARGREKKREKEEQQRLRAERREFIERVKGEAKALGLQVEVREVGEAERPAKYIHPENGRVSWDGAGRPPKWIGEYEKTGGKREDLLAPKFRGVGG